MQLEILFPVQALSPALRAPTVEVRGGLGWCGHAALTTPKRSWGGSEARHAECKGCGARVTFHAN